MCSSPVVDVRSIYRHKFYVPSIVSQLTLLRDTQFDWTSCRFRWVADDEDNSSKFAPFVSFDCHWRIDTVSETDNSNRFHWTCCRKCYDRFPPLPWTFCHSYLFHFCSNRKKILENTTKHWPWLQRSWNEFGEHVCENIKISIVFRFWIFGRIA